MNFFILNYFSNKKNFINKLDNLLNLEKDLNLEELTEKDICSIFDYKNELKFLFFFISNLDIKFNFSENIIKNIFLISEENILKSDK